MQPGADESAAVFVPPPASIPLSMDLLLTPGEHIIWRDVADCTIQADIVAVLAETTG